MKSSLVGKEMKANLEGIMPNGRFTTSITLSLSSLTKHQRISSFSPIPSIQLPFSSSDILSSLPNTTYLPFHHMGANSSSSIPPHSKPEQSPLIRPKLEDIPEASVALVLSYLDPLQICKLARLNRAFRAASEADFIWDSKLPTNYPYILHTFLHQNHANKDKKDIFATLSRPISFDDGNKEVWIDKRTGGVCVSISSRAMSITGIDDRRYWNQIITDESRFGTIAYLQQIWWLEVDGDLEFQFPAGTYSMFFRLQLGKVIKRHGRRPSNSDNIHGWDIKPVEFQLTTQDGQHAVSRKTLDNVGTWVNYHVGDFVVHNTNVSTRIKFSLTQIDCTHTKGGLCVDSVLICPANLGKEHL